MATVATRPTRVSDVVKFEFGLERNYERSMQTLTVAAATAEIGQVYHAADGDLLVAADTAGPLTAGLWILVDDTIYTDGHATGDGSYAVLSGGVGASGAAEVVLEALKFGDALDAAQKNLVIAQLNAQGIRVASQV